MAGNQREGPAYLDIAELDARQLGRDAAMVTVRWVCRRPDGSTIWDFADSYLVALEQAGGASSVTWCTPRAHGPSEGSHEHVDDLADGDRVAAVVVLLPGGLDRAVAPVGVAEAFVQAAGVVVVQADADG